MLVQCKECGARISSQARTCPQCGKPRYTARIRRELIFSLIEAAIAIAALIWVLWKVGLIHPIIKGTIGG